MDNDTLVNIYRQMLLVRKLDERLWTLNRQGKAAIVPSSQGHEAAQIGSVWAMRKDTDLFYIYYRDLAVLIAAGMKPKDIIKGFMAKDGEPMSSARQFPTHGAIPKLGIVNLSNVVATQLPQAVGAALASKMRGEETVVITYFGDGASSAGDTHEAMNFAGIHKIPVIFFCENNRYATSVPINRQMAVDHLASRAAGYGMPGVTIDGCDVVQVYQTVSRSVERARNGLGPTFIEAMVERHLPHTSDDDDRRYRSVTEISEAKKKDPVTRLREHLITNHILTEEIDVQYNKLSAEEIDEATDLVDMASYPSIDDFHKYVYGDDVAE